MNFFSLYIIPIILIWILQFSLYILSKFVKLYINKNYSILVKNTNATVVKEQKSKKIKLDSWMINIISLIPIINILLLLPLILMIFGQIMMLIGINNTIKKNNLERKL